MKKAIVHYLEDLDITTRRSELFRETNHSAELMRCAWKDPIRADEALEILASMGKDPLTNDVNTSIESTCKSVDRKYARAYKELQEHE